MAKIETEDHSYEEGFKHGYAGELWDRFAPAMKKMGAKKAEAFHRGFYDGRMAKLREEMKR